MTMAGLLACMAAMACSDCSVCPGSWPGTGRGTGGMALGCRPPTRFCRQAATHHQPHISVVHVRKRQGHREHSTGLQASHAVLQTNSHTVLFLFCHASQKEAGHRGHYTGLQELESTANLTTAKLAVARILSKTQ
jgi:hypothetical protein